MTKFKLFIFIFLYLIVILTLTISNFIKNTPVPRHFLVLGLDPRNDLLEKTETTDTIMYANLSPQFTNIKMFSLPRDLWFYPINKKINSIYPDSLKAPNKFDFIQTSFSQVTGQNIDRTIIITTEDLKQIIDIIGGVDVYLDKELKDEKYPNQDYIDHPNPKTPIYKTIFYPQGINHLDSSNISEFVRSRKSSDIAQDGGTDLGRIARQQQLLNSLLSKVPKIRDPHQLILLCKYFDKSIAHNLTKQDYLILGIKLLPHLKDLVLNKISIPTGENPKTDIIYHPQTFINKQWVFITQDPGYNKLHQFIKDQLHD